MNVVEIKNNFFLEKKKKRKKFAETAIVDCYC